MEVNKLLNIKILYARGYPIFSVYKKFFFDPPVVFTEVKNKKKSNNYYNYFAVFLYKTP